MTPRMQKIDGSDYLDASSSDAAAIGWMKGAPPPLDKRIRFEDDQFFTFPKIRWSLSHMRELVPTVNVWRGAGAASDLGAVDSSTAAAIDTMTFKDMNGQMRTWADSLTATYTDSIVVLHKGKRVYERHLGAMQPHTAHACFSITKSYAATLASMLLLEGTLDENRLIPFYLPEMAGTAYADATLRQVMDMQIDVAYSEVYSDPKAQIWDYARAGGFRARAAGYSGPDNLYEFLLTLKKEGQHGEAFAYKTVNTELLCWIMARVTGQPLAEQLSQRIWSRLGCEEDAYLSVDSIGVAFGGGGLSACLRDLARFGEMMRCGGAYNHQQIVPDAVVADIARGTDPARFAKAGYALLPGYSYRNMWWVTHNAHGAFEARGIHGQRLYVAPQADMVVARLGSHPIASSAAHDPITVPALLALGQLLMAG